MDWEKAQPPLSPFPKGELKPILFPFPKPEVGALSRESDKKSEFSVDKNLHITLLLMLICAFCLSCASVNSIEEMRRPAEYPLTQVTLFLNGPERAFKDITWHIDSISLLDQKGAAVRLVDTALLLRSTEIRSRQMKLAERPVPEGKYVGMLIAAKRASVRSGEKDVDLSLAEEATTIPLSVTVSRNQAIAIFLKWEPDSSVVDDYLFRPVVYARPQEPGLTSLMIYVTNEDSHNVYVINRQTNEVVATILVGRGPRGLAANTISTDQKIFVANSVGNSISIVDARRNIVETEMPIRFGREPVAVAAARLSPVFENVYVANYSSNNVSVLDGRTYQEVERIDVGNGPVAVVADPPLETAFASALSASDMETLRNYRSRYLNVYVANRDDRSISVLKVNTSTGRTEGVTTVPVEWTPVRLFVDYPSATLYGVHRDCDCISVINIVQLIRGNVSGAVSYIRFVGMTGADIAVDKTMNRIYFLKESPAEVLVLRPLQSTPSMAAGAASMLGLINAGSKPRAFMLDPESRRLYLIDSATEALMVIDKATREQEKIIPLGRRPYGISMFAD